VESIAQADASFIESLTSSNAESLLRSEEIISRMPRLMHYTGILAYRNAFPRDPYLQLWAGLGFLQSGDFKAAIGSFQIAQLNGISHWRVQWYCAVAAERGGFAKEAAALVNEVLRSAVNFLPALEMKRRLEATAPVGGPATPTSGDLVLRYVEEAGRLLQSGQPARARDPLQAALRIVPGQLGLIEILCDVEFRMGNMSEARRLFAAILKSDPRRSTDLFKRLSKKIPSMPTTRTSADKIDTPADTEPTCLAVPSR